MYSPVAEKPLVKLINDAILELDPLKHEQVTCLVCAELSSYCDVQDFSHSEYLELVNLLKSCTHLDATLCTTQCITALHPPENLPRYVCNHCCSQLKRKLIPIKSLRNDLDFGLIPDELQNLTFVEEMLIARCRVRGCIIKLQFKGQANVMLSQRALRGNIISFSQNTDQITRHISLPALQSLHEDVQILFVGCTKSSAIRARVRPLCTVNRARVSQALHWKRQNDPYYATITVDYDLLNQLPLDDIPERLWEEALDELPEDHLVGSAYVTQADAAESDTCLIDSVGYVDNAGNSVTYAEVMSNAINNVSLQIPHATEPLSEYTDDFWYAAFPVLLPYGRSGPNQQRPRKLSFQAWVTHCLKFHDQRFVRHKLFAFVCQNVRQRHEYNRRASLRCKSGQATATKQRLEEITAHDLTIMADLLQKKKRLSADQYTDMQTLLTELRSVAAPVDNTLFAKLFRRNELRAMICYNGLPEIWFTLNPADNRHPLVAIFAGKDLATALNLSVFERCRLLAENPLAPALFFHKCVEVFVNMLKNGLLGEYKGHYGVIEAQGRGSLHIHMLVWLKSVKSRKRKHQQLATDPDQLLCQYVDTILCATLEEHPSNDVLTPENPCSAFATAIHGNSLSTISPVVDRIVRETNMHAPSHNATCFKYNHSSCRFNFPRDLLSATYINPETREVVPKRTNAWLNPYNKAVSYVFRCNHDLKYIPSSQDSKALIYYLTEYATKSELSSHELLALLAAAYTDFDVMKQSLRSEDLHKRLLVRCINKIGSVREQPHQVVVSDLLGLPAFYTNFQFKSLNWISVLKYLEGEGDELNVTRNSTCDDAEHSEMKGSVKLTNLRLNYMFRGRGLGHVSLYYYCALFYTEKINHNKNYSTQTTFFFDNNHPCYQTHVQRLRTAGHLMVPCLIGPKISAATSSESDMYAKAILVIFKPWKRAEDLLGACDSWNDALADFLTWEDSVGKPYAFADSRSESQNLPTTFQLIANLSALHDCEIQAGISSARRREQTSLSEQELPLVDQNCIEHDHGVSSEEDEDEGAVLIPLLDLANLQKQTPMDAFTLIGSRTFVQAADLSALLASTHASPITANTQLVQHLDVNLDLQDLHVPHARPCVDPINQTLLVYPLHSTQEIPFKTVARHLLTRESVPLQMIVSGEAGTGKSQVIRAIQYLFQITGNSDALQVTASTGTAAAALGGATIHSVLKLRSSIVDKTSTSFLNIYNRMCNIRYIIIDEISMVDCTLFYTIHNRLQFLFTNNTLFGGVSIILFGDLNQFPPVTGKPLYDDSEWKALETERKSNSAMGRHLWSQIQNVTLLSHNFRQQSDLQMCTILKNFLNNCVSKVDFALLKSRMLSRDTPIPHDAPIIVTRNLLRTRINTYIVKNIASSLSNHEMCTMLASDTCSSRDISPPDIQNFLQQRLPDHETEALPGNLLLFPNCKLMLTKNIDPKRGLANGTPVWLYQVPSAGSEAECVLVRLPKPLAKPFDGLPCDVAPISRVTETFTLKELGKNVSIRRRQFPLIYGYAITDYKSQGASLKNCIIDLRKPPGSWQAFHSLYVMLSRVETLNGLNILTSFDETVFKQEKPPALKKELQRLQQLSDQCIADFHSDDFDHS